MILRSALILVVIHATALESQPRRILFFTAPWCAACEHLKREDFPLMQQQRWQIGPEATNHVQEIDVDENPELADLYQIESLPTFILLVNGEEKARYGYLTGSQIAWLWLGKAPNVAD